MLKIHSFGYVSSVDLPLLVTGSEFRNTEVQIHVTNLLIFIGKSGICGDMHYFSYSVCSVALIVGISTC